MMTMKRLVIILLLIAASAVPLKAGEKSKRNASFHDRVVSTYNFLPRNLSEKEINAKSLELDAFWSDVKSHGPQGLEELRTELKRSDMPVFFYFDGAKLLLSLSKSQADL